MKIDSLASGIAIATVLGFSLLAEASESDVIAFTCDNCSYTAAKNLIRDRTIPSFHCTPDNRNEIITMRNQICHSQPIFSMVLNKSTGTFWGGRSSHTNQGKTPMTMQLQVEQYNHSSTIKNMIRDGVQYTEDLSGALQNVASKVSDSFATATAYEQWVNGQKKSMTNLTSTTSSSSEFSCTESSEYQAMKAIISGEFRNRLRAKINDAYSDEDLQLKGNFDNIEFTEFGLRLEKTGFTVSLNWDNQQVDKTPFFTFPTPDLLATKNNQEISQVAFKLSPSDNGTSISLDGTKTHISRKYYWVDMTNPRLSTVELSPCAAEALSEAYGTVSVSATGDTGSDNYKPMPGKKSLFPEGAPEEESRDKNPLCEVRYSDKLGKHVITIKTLC